MADVLVTIQVVYVTIGAGLTLIHQNLLFC